MQTATATRGTVTIKGRTFAIPQPTQADISRVRDRMRDLALAGCTSPILAVNAVAKELPPAVFAAAMEAAVSKAAGGGAEPTPDAVNRQYGTLEGIRFQLWYFAKKGGSPVTLKEIEDLVGEEDRYEVDDALYRATQLGDLPGPKVSPGGESLPTG